MTSTTTSSLGDELGRRNGEIPPPRQRQVRAAASVWCAVATRLLLAAAAVGCGPTPPDDIPKDAVERYATAMCDAHRRCGCLGEGFASALECKDAAVSVFDGVAGRSDVAFDRECFDEFLDHVEDSSCEGHIALECGVFRPTKKFGDACEPDVGYVVTESGEIAGGALGVLGECPIDGACVDGRCAEVTPHVGEGAPCHLSLGVQCAPGLYCDRGGACRPQLATGAACNSAAACGITESEELYCEGLTSTEAVGTCASVPPVGGTCDRSEIAVCGYGRYCSLSGVCVEDWPPVCMALVRPPGMYNPVDWIPR